MKTSILAFTLVAFAAAAAVTWALLPRGPEHVAKESCKEQVLHQLHDPPSVEWVEADTWPVDASGEERGYKVAMKARATNAMGARVLATMSCEVIVSEGHGIVISVD